MYTKKKKWNFKESRKIWHVVGNTSTRGKTQNVTYNDDDENDDDNDDDVDHNEEDGDWKYFYYAIFIV